MLLAHDVHTGLWLTNASARTLVGGGLTRNVKDNLALGSFFHSSIPIYERLALGLHWIWSSSNAERQRSLAMAND